MAEFGGDKIEKDEPLLEISTDKVDAEVPSPVAGTLLEIRTNEGETVEVGSIVGVVGAEGSTELTGTIIGQQTSPSPNKTLLNLATATSANAGASETSYCLLKKKESSIPMGVATMMPLVRNCFCRCFSVQDAGRTS